MSNDRHVNMLGMDQQRYSNMMGRNIVDQDSVDGHMTGQGSIGPNMMDRNIHNIMSNRGMTADLSNTIGQQMSSNMMGQDMTVDVMGRNVMAQDRNSQLMGRQSMSPNMMYGNMMDMNNSRMSSNMMNANRGVMGQRMVQQMEMKRVPETYTSTRFF